MSNTKESCIGTLPYLIGLKTILIKSPVYSYINVLIFSHLNYCSSIWGKCSEKLQNEIQKCINFVAKVASNSKYWKRYHVTPLLKLDLKRLHETVFRYKNLHIG